LPAAFLTPRGGGLAKRFFNAGKNVPVRTARRAFFRHTSRTAGCIGLAAALVVLGSDGLQNAIANGDTRTISFHNLHTNEDLTVTFKRNGRYDADALKKVNQILRDWRRNEETKMDPHLIDTVWEVYREVGGKEAIHIICGYRAPSTNAMLRRRSSGVAQFSQHTQGKALDFMIPGVPLEELRHAGLRLQRGGVGFYPSSGSPFVHVDVGSVRHWPRMTHDQLVKVFPDGRTVHVPSDGQPLKNYALALADLEKRGSAPSATSLEAAKAAGVNVTSKQNVLAKLFGFGKKDDEDEPDVTKAAETETAEAAPASRKLAFVRPANAEPTLPAVPMPKSRPNVEVASVRTVAPEQNAGGTYAVASATSVPVPSDVFNSRGYWRGAPELPADMAAAYQSIPEFSSADTKPTGSIGPWMREQAPGELAIGYASPYDAKAEPRPAARMAPMGQAIKRAPIAPDTTVATKATKEAPTLIQSSLAQIEGRGVPQADSPWLAAIVATPSVVAFMNTTIYGAQDFRKLQPLLRKPTAVLAMTFSDNPNPGLHYQAFVGSAVVFIASVSLPSQTRTIR
jgi:uncharacterized protein YcbK (DUF882 family)